MSVPQDNLNLNNGQNPNNDNLDDLESNYQFFRTLVKRHIFQMTNVNDQRILSTWLNKCDEEENKSLSCGYITLMLVSFHNSGGHIGLFKSSVPSELQEITNTPAFLYKMIEDHLLNDSNLEDDYDGRNKCQNSIHAAVSSDMTSFATMLVDEYCVQVFYARSDHTMDTWILPEHVQLPVYSHSPPQWERALSTSPRTVHKRLTVIKNTNQKNEEVSEKISMEERCRGLMGEQISMGLNIKHAFQWYHKSKLNGTLRPINEVCIDKDTCRHEKNQLELDERAFNILNRMYPGCVRIVIAPRLIAEVTGIHVGLNNKDHHGLNNHRNTLKIDPNCCENISQETVVQKLPDNDDECPTKKNVPKLMTSVQNCQSFKDDLTRVHSDVSELCQQPEERTLVSVAFNKTARSHVEDCVENSPEKSCRPVTSESVQCDCNTEGSNGQLNPTTDLVIERDTERVIKTTGCESVENTTGSPSAEPRCSLHGKSCASSQAVTKSINIRFRAGSDNPGMRCPNNHCCGQRRGRETVARQPMNPRSHQRITTASASRIPVTIGDRPDQVGRIDRPVQLYQRSMLPVPSRQGPAPARIPRPAVTVCNSRRLEAARNAPVQQQSQPNMDPNERRRTYNVSQPIVPQFALRDVCSWQDGGTINSGAASNCNRTNTAPSCSRTRATTGCGRISATTGCSRTSVAASCGRISAATSCGRTSVATDGSSVGCGVSGGGGGGGGGGGCGGGGGGGCRNHTFTVSGTIRMDNFPEQALAERQPRPSAAPRSQSNNYEAVEAYFDNPQLDEEVVAPRSLAVPGCPYVRIDDSASTAGTPEPWREMLDNRSSIGSQALSIDRSPVFEYNNVSDDGYLPDVSSEFSESSRPFGLDDSFVMDARGQQDVAARRRSRAASAGPDRSPPCVNHRRDSFDRNTH